MFTFLLDNKMLEYALVLHLKLEKVYITQQFLHECLADHFEHKTNVLSIDSYCEMGKHLVSCSIFEMIRKAKFKTTKPVLL